ncbi:P-loop containing nucleoside triphosphate hydrolase protein [Lineolata rhizophorae]|uniref:P-loop containing nucleoside triphosphate hydrolase protein n=1 Tax=Lineolata rhizophorae TaxID=578093 RepID=A0A6A6PG97_9PEZI|nr:P-loop containing nucleoside triphosphate hydrolase protein [Lineolata rhizophorae]
MTDLHAVLPAFDTRPFTHLLPSLERAAVSLADLLTLDPADVARRAQLPAAQVRVLVEAVAAALRADVGWTVEEGEEEEEEEEEDWAGGGGGGGGGRRARDEADGEDDDGAGASAGAEDGGRERRDVAEWRSVSLLDARIDEGLGGGIPTGYVTEVTGESGAGKTQFLLTLLLSVQLPPPAGLSKSALYISTESALPTVRLAQLLRNHPRLQQHHQKRDNNPKTATTTTPSLSRIHTISTPDLEAQEHILRYQLPVAIARYNVGLVAIDSIAANFRAEFDVPAPAADEPHQEQHGEQRRQAAPAQGRPTKRRRKEASLACRARLLVQLGGLLRGIARREGVAVVVVNQVADRFGSENGRNGGIGPGGGYNSYNHSYVNSGNGILNGSGNGCGNGNGNGNGTGTNLTTPTTATPQPRPTAPTSPFPPPSTPPLPSLPNPLTFDHQQRFFTGWGDDEPPPLLPSASASASTSAFPSSAQPNLKTPALGLVWANQIAARVALIKTPHDQHQHQHQHQQQLQPQRADEQPAAAAGGGVSSGWRRTLRVAFAAWAAASPPGEGVAFEITGEGVRSVVARVDEWGGCGERGGEVAGCGSEMGAKRWVG